METTTVLVACAAVAAAAATAHRVRGERAVRRALSADLAALEDVEAPASRPVPALRELVEEERIARLVLAAQVRRLREIPVTPLLGRGRLADYDHAVEGARRVLWEFVHAVHALPRDTRSRLWQAGFSPRPLEALVLVPGVFERTDDPYAGALVPRRPRAAVVHDALVRASRELDRFEAAVARLSRLPYR